MRPIILIPVYNPDEKLLAALEGMREAGFRQFVLVDDGSRPECLPVFEEALGKGDCALIRHAINLGKGRALKTGFNYVLNAFPDAPGVITMDADGQHPPGAALRVAAAMERHPDALVLGVRKFYRPRTCLCPTCWATP
jgi:glycosyltransferase involved in cell wall biosynthesis